MRSFSAQSFVIPLLVVALVMAGCVPATARGASPMRQAPIDEVRPPMSDALTAADDYGKLPLYFVENRGQLDALVGYYAHARGGTAYFTADGVTIAIGGGRAPEDRGDPAGDRPIVAQRYVVKPDFLGTSPDARVVGATPTDATFNYFKGRPEQWITGVPTYAGAAYEGLWPGVDLVYGGEAGHLKYELRLQPGADPDRIAFGYRGATGVRLNERGALDVRTPIGGLLDQPSYAYQEIDGRRVSVPATFTVEQDDEIGVAVVRFALGAYDRALPCCSTRHTPRRAARRVQRSPSRSRCG